jgi:hypothetical protein
MKRDKHGWDGKACWVRIRHSVLGGGKPALMGLLRRNQRDSQKYEITKQSQFKNAMIAWFYRGEMMILALKNKAKKATKSHWKPISKPFFGFEQAGKAKRTQC